MQLKPGVTGQLKEGRQWIKYHTLSIVAQLIMCIIHTMKSADLMKMLKKAGWKTVRIRGSHHQMTHPDFRHALTVPHPKKELGKGLVNAILKQAGLKE